MAERPKNKTFQQLKERASAGDLQSQCTLALIYEIGIDSDCDLKEAIPWWQKAADNGSAWAMEKLSSLISKGQLRGTKSQAFEWHEKAKKLAFKNFDEWLTLAKPKTAERRVKELHQKVLVIDDKKDLAELVSSFLQKSGFEVITRSDGLQGMDAISQNPDISCVVLDLKMPQMNGLQFVQMLRNLKILEGIPIIIMTAYSKPEYIQMGKKLKVSAWLTKPFQFNNLIDTVKKLTHKR